MTRICNREGCTRHVFARAKCVSHYNSYIKSLRRKGSTLHAAVDTWAEVQKAMPGTLGQLSQRTEIAYNTVRKTVTAKHKAGEAHIVSHLPPEESGGSRLDRVRDGVGMKNDMTLSDWVFVGSLLFVLVSVLTVVVMVSSCH